MARLTISVFLITALSSAFADAVERSVLRSHPPTRTLPIASRRSMGEGPARFADAKNGSDKNDGSKAKPWKTVGHAVSLLKAADTLYLRGGTYYESVAISLKGTPEKPIMIRAFPRELAIVDAGFRRFYESPATAREPVENGAPGEFRSQSPYKTGGNFGNFGDSMIPLQRYITFNDLRSKNELWHTGLSNRTNDPKGIYAGPGVRRDPKTGRIHIRLSHTKLAGPGKNHYRVATSPDSNPDTTRFRTRRSHSM